MVIQINVAVATEEKSKHRRIESRGEPQDHGCDDDIDHDVAAPAKIHRDCLHVALCGVALQLWMGANQQGHDLVRQEDRDDGLNEEGHKERTRETEAEDSHTDMLLHRIRFEDLGEVRLRFQVRKESTIVGVDAIGLHQVFAHNGPARTGGP